MREQPSEQRDVTQSRHALEGVALVVANQSCQHVRLAVAQADDCIDLAVAERRQPAEAGAGDVGHRDIQLQRYVVVEVGARRDRDVHADVLIVERGDRLLWRAAGGDRREGGHRYGHLFTELRRRLQAIRGSELRVRERPCIRIRLQQPVVQRRDGG